MTNDQLKAQIDAAVTNKIAVKSISPPDVGINIKAVIDYVDEHIIPQVNSDWNSVSGVTQILNKPTIPGAQLNSDWNSVSGVTQILNKPTIPSIAGLATTSYVDAADNLKVDKIAGKGLSTNDYTTVEVVKLLSIATGAEVNVNADWNAVSGDALILNKPTIPTLSNANNPFEKADQGSGEGVFVRGREDLNYGPIGLDAFDISYSDELSSVNGATGINSFAVGQNVISSGYTANSLGYLIDNSSTSGTTAGINLQNAGYANFITGTGNNVTGMNVTVLGQAANIISEQILDFNSNPAIKTLLTVGNGTITNNDALYPVLTRSDAFKVMMDGAVLAPSLTIAMITSGNNRMLVTKEYLSTGIQAVSASVSGIVNNTSLQELGGVDKLIHGVRVGIGQGTGTENTAVGADGVLSLNTTGANNTVMGFGAMLNNTTGINNSAFGNYAFRDSTSGNYNTGVGNASLRRNTTGSQNTGIGTASVNSTTSGNNNTGLGHYALYSNLTGNNNIAVGTAAGAFITGSGNIVMATESPFVLSGITSGSNNMVLSPNSGNATGLTTGSGNVILGKVTGISASASNTVTLADGVGNIALIKSTDNTLTSPNLTIALISAEVSGRVLITKEYFNSFDSGNVKLIGNQTISGIKTFLNTSGIVNGLNLTNSAIGQETQVLSLNNSSEGRGMYSTNTSTGIGVQIDNTSTGKGLYVFNSVGGYGIQSGNVSTGIGIFASNAGTGSSIHSLNGGSGSGIVSNGGTTATGMNYVGQDDGNTTFTVTKQGVLSIGIFTVATLPTPINIAYATVSDALAPSYMTTVVGGGTVVTPVFYDGSTWKAH